MWRRNKACVSYFSQKRDFFQIWLVFYRINKVVTFILLLSIKIKMKFKSCHNYRKLNTNKIVENSRDPATCDKGGYYFLILH